MALAAAGAPSPSLGAATRAPVESALPLIGRPVWTMLPDCAKFANGLGALLPPARQAAPRSKAHQEASAAALEGLHQLIRRRMFQPLVRVGGGGGGGGAVGGDSMFARRFHDPPLTRSSWSSVNRRSSSRSIVPSLPKAGSIDIPAFQASRDSDLAHSPNRGSDEPRGCPCG